MSLENQLPPHNTPRSNFFPSARVTTIRVVIFGLLLPASIAYAPDPGSTALNVT